MIGTFIHFILFGAQMSGSALAVEPIYGLKSQMIRDKSLSPKLFVAAFVCVMAAVDHEPAAAEPSALADAAPH